MKLVLLDHSFCFDYSHVNCENYAYRVTQAENSMDLIRYDVKK